MAASPLLLEPVVDFPQSHESDFELLSLLSSFLSHPDVLLPELEELELEELDSPLLLLLLLEDDDELEDDELEELDELDDELVLLELGESVLLLPQLSLLVSGSLLVSVPVEEVLPQPWSATVSSSPVSS